MAGIKIEVIRPFLVRGDHCGPAGRIVSLAPADALLVLESGRGKLVNDSDMTPLREVQRKATAAALKSEGRPWHARSEADGGPWRRA